MATAPTPQDPAPAGASRAAVVGIVALVALLAVAAAVWAMRSTDSRSTAGSTASAAATVPAGDPANASGSATPAETTSSAAPATSASAGPQSTPAGASVDEGYRAFAEVDLKPGAPVVTVFEDFQCPVCVQFEQAVGATLTELAEAGDIQLNYRVMNFLDAKLGVSQSTPVAIGAFCAADQGKFQEFHDAAFAGQYPEGTSVSVEQVAAFATTAKVADLDEWTTCVRAAPYTEYVAQSDATATSDGVLGTPTVWIDGKETPLREIATPAGLKQAISDATE